MQEELSKRCTEYAEHISKACGIPSYVMCTFQKAFIYSSETPRFCEGCTSTKCVEINTHLYGCNEAYRWNGQYIYYCPLGLVFAAASVSDETGNLTGGIIMGPLLMGDAQDILAELPKSMRGRAKALPAVEPSMVSHLSALLSAVAAYVCGLPHSMAGGFVYEQEKILNAIYSAHEHMLGEEEQVTYPIETEKQLHRLICSGDKSGAQELLNQLLGHIYFASNFDLKSIKTRVVELIVILSRATIDAGADIREVFLFNTNYIQEIDRFDSIEELSVWLTGIMNRFISYSFDFNQVKHSNVVYKVMEYVKANYSKKLTLDDIARHVYLSRSYLSSIFKEETGQSLFSYVNSVRVEKSRMFLLDNSISLVDISEMCGFEDQSYFTKVFKKAMGVSPKKYRDSRGVLPNTNNVQK
jgi:AraC-like DNA-binding protein